MTPRAKGLVAVVASAAVAIAVIAAVAVGWSILPIHPSTSKQRSLASTFPPPPANCRAYDVGPDYAKVNCGPTIVGKFVAAAPIINATRTKASMKISWAPARDDLYPTGITYDFKKNGTYLWRNRAQTYANVGYANTVTTFKTCVIAHSQSGYGPERCTTWTATTYG